MTTKQTPLPDAAYESAVMITADLLIRFREMLEDVPHVDSGKINWGHVGTMNHVNSMLTEVMETFADIK